MSYREKIDKISKEAFQEAKRLLMEKRERSCIYFQECNEENEDNYDDFCAIVDTGFFMSRYVCDVKGVRIAESGVDPYGDSPTLEINLIDDRDEIFWTEANNMHNLFYPDMADFVTRNIDKAITPEECKVLMEEEWKEHNEESEDDDEDDDDDDDDEDED